MRFHLSRNSPPGSVGTKALRRYRRHFSSLGFEKIRSSQNRWLQCREILVITELVATMNFSPQLIAFQIVFTEGVWSRAREKIEIAIHFEIGGGKTDAFPAGPISRGVAAARRRVERLQEGVRPLQRASILRLQPEARRLGR
jgi:hypothetical protein